MVQVEWCVDSDEVEWENPESAVADAHIAEARERNMPVLSEFHFWGADDDG